MNSQDVRDWISRLSKPHPAFGGQSACPFADRAVWGMVACFDAEGVQRTLRGNSLSLGEVAIVKIPVEIPDLDALVEAENKILRLRDHLALISDPARPMVIAGFQTTQTDSQLIILQRLSELEVWRALLKKRGYYQSWDAESLRRIGVSL